MSTSLKLRTMRVQQELSEEMKQARLPTKGEALLVSFASLWFFVGLLTDGWAHNHIPELESFFTPWHAIFYSGYAATAAVLIGIVYRTARRNSVPFLRAVPIGYDWACMAVPLFFLGGIGDLLWHEIFGIEKDIEALLSPTHLILAVSMFLMVSANLRSWLLSVPPIGRPSFFAEIPMLLSLVMTVSIPAFMNQFSHFITMRAGGDMPSLDIAMFLQNISITGFLLHTIILLGIFFVVIERGKFPRGTFTFTLTLSTLAMGVMRDGLALIPAAVLTGVFADILAEKMHPLEQHVKQLRVFGFFVPAVFFTAYFLTIQIVNGIWWSVHLWSGSIVMCGLAGILLSFVVVPPSERVRHTV